MYPTFKEQAAQEGHTAVQEFQEQIEESIEHAEEFKAVLAKAELRFAALTKIEKRHAAAYQQVMEAL
jgi:rubrerythrin